MSSCNIKVWWTNDSASIYGRDSIVLQLNAEGIKILTNTNNMKLKNKTKLRIIGIAMIIYIIIGIILIIVNH